MCRQSQEKVLLFLVFYNTVLDSHTIKVHLSLRKKTTPHFISISKNSTDLTMLLTATAT